MMQRLLVIFMFCVWAVPAHADRHNKSGKPKYTERQKQSIALLKRAMRQYDLGKFDEAIAMFEQAYQEHPWPVILFNLGQAHRQKKTYERALFYYRAYLRQPDTEHRATVENSSPRSRRSSTNKKPWAKNHHRV